MLEVCAVMQVAHVSTLNLFAYKSLIGVTFPPPLCVTSRRDGWASTLRSLKASNGVEREDEPWSR